MTLREQFALKLTEARKAYEAGDIEQGDKLKSEAESLKTAMAGVAELDGLQEDVKALPPMRPGLPGAGAGTLPSLNGDNSEDDDEAAQQATSLKTVYQLRFGDEIAKNTQVMTDLLGADYRQPLLDQMKAFGRYLRFGAEQLDRDEIRLLKTQVFAYEDIKSMVSNGFSVDEVKSTMVEAQGTLGGYAVPSTMQSEILRRLPGLTAVRGNGAMVVNLTTGNSTEFVELTGGNDRYTSALRGAWGSETQSPAEKNLTLGLKTVNANVYTYKVPMSTSLVEDATNLVDILQRDAADTMAIDEDEAFLIGSGGPEPLGILPGSSNSLSLGEVNTGAAAALTANGLKALKRGIASQYRRDAVFVANSDTYLDVEQLVDGQGQYLFPDLSDEERLLARRAAESEAMPDVAASAYPMIFGNMRGYGIVERSGMTIARFQDSNTGINKVEFHFRRRVGGRVVMSWMFAVHKVSA